MLSVYSLLKRKILALSFRSRSKQPKKKVRSNQKRCVTFQRAHNNMFTHMARARCSDACPPAATLVSLAALFMSLQLARPNPPSTFPTHVDWCMDASMSGSLVPTHTNDAPRHPTPRMQHQTSPPALLDGTGLLQMPPKGLSHLKPSKATATIGAT